MPHNDNEKLRPPRKPNFGDPEHEQKYGAWLVPTQVVPRQQGRIVEVINEEAEDETVIEVLSPRTNR